MKKRKHPEIPDWLDAMSLEEIARDPRPRVEWPPVTYSFRIVSPEPLPVDIDG